MTNILEEMDKVIFPNSSSLIWNFSLFGMFHLSAV